MQRLSLAAIACLVCTAAAAEPLAILHSNNGTVAPPYRVDVTVTIGADLLVTVKECKSYDETTCKTYTGLTTDEALAAIETAARDAGCPGKPLAENPNPPVGGGFSSGSVLVDGTACALPAFAVPEDEARKQSIVAAINRAVPADLSAAGD